MLTPSCHLVATALLDVALSLAVRWFSFGTALACLSAASVAGQNPQREN